MRILVFEPLKEPYVKDIEDDIQAMQEVVGGSIEPIYFEQTNDALCWCNDEFLLNGSKPNRIIGNTLCSFPSKTQKNYTQNTKKAVKCFIYPKHLTAFIMYEIFKNCFYKATLIPL